MAWGDGIERNPRAKPPKNTDSDLEIVLALFAFIIAASLAYLAYDKWRERREMEEFVEQAEREVKKADRMMEKSLARERRREEERANRYTPAKRIGGVVEYPDLAKERGLHGTAKIQVYVDSFGRVEDVKLAQTAGHEILDRYALKAAKNSAYRPAQRGYESIDDIVMVEISF